MSLLVTTHKTREGDSQEAKMGKKSFYFLNLFTRFMHLYNLKMINVKSLMKKKGPRHYEHTEYTEGHRTFFVIIFLYFFCVLMLRSGATSQSSTRAS